MAVTAYLIRQYFPTHTIGVLTAIDATGNALFSGVVLELPWKDNQFQVSCIPEGCFRVTRRWTKKFKWHYLIHDVPGRSDILQHTGNYTHDILGCQLPGNKITNLDGDKIPDVANTRLTLDKMLKLFGTEYTLYIGSFEPPKHQHIVSPSLFWQSERI